MANLTTSADILDDVLFRAGEPTDSTSDFYAAALRYLNRAYQTIWMGGGELDPSLVNTTWWWLRKATPGTLTLLPEITTGTVLVTNNSTSITFSSAPPASVAGYHFKATDHGDVFRISAHTAAATAATLDAVYTGATTAAATFWLRKVEYDLASDVMNIIGPIRVYQDGVYDISMMEAREIDRMFPLATLDTGMPRAFATIGERLTSSDPMTVRFSHAGGSGGSTDLIRADYDYLALPSDLADDTAEPLLPRQYRKILSDLAGAWVMTDKNDNRAPSLMGAAKAGLQAMARENRRRWQTAGSTMGHIYPRPNHLSAFAPPLRTSSGLIIG